VYCYGAPVFDASGQSVAGIGVCIHKGRLGADRGARHLRMLLEVAQRLSQRLGWDLPPASGPTAARPRSSGASR
jgi:IclR family transcriptional regulator, blcABC operon repressor